RATQPVDRAICTTPDLRRLDQSIATAYRRLLADLDRNGAAALRDDQRVFINARNRTAADRTGAELITELRGWLQQRAKT
ncbi:lysozyme inhibitor LprI family protein, partial [Escherichia coli]|uniref:lysozyme inhibitor LprI family protein n=1 Tax=Escherichia coli TaxID=562 RepID=UPI0015C44BB0